MANFSENQSGWKHEFQLLQAAHAAVQVKYISLKEKHTAKLALLDYYWKRCNNFEAKEVKWKEKEKHWEERVKLLENNKSNVKDNVHSDLFNEKIALTKANTLLEKLNKDNERKIKIQSEELKSVSMNLSESLKAKDELLHCNSQVENLETERCKLMAKNSLLEQQVLSLNEKVSGWEVTNKNLLEKISALEKRVGLTNQLDVRTKKISSLEKDICVLSHDNTRLVSQNSDLHERCSVLEKINQEPKAKIVMDTEEIEDDYLEFEKKMQQETLLVTNKNLLEKLSALEQQNKDLRAELEVNTKKMSSLEKDNLALSNDKFSLVRKLQRDLLEKNTQEFKSELIMDIDTEEIEDDYLEFEKKMEEETNLLQSHKELTEFKVKAVADNEILQSQLSLKSNNIASLETRISHFEKVIDDLNSSLNNERMSHNDLRKEHIALIAALSEKREEVARQKEINGLAQLNLIRKDNEIINLIKCNSTLSSEKLELEKQFELIQEELQKFESTYDKMRMKYGKCVTIHGDSALQFYEFLSNTVCTNFTSFSDYLTLIKSSKMLEAGHQLTQMSPFLSSPTGSSMDTEPTGHGNEPAGLNSSFKVTLGPIKAEVASGTPVNPTIIVRKLKRPSDNDRVVKMRKLASDEEEDVNVEI